jgi:hypothetical protein
VLVLQVCVQTWPSEYLITERLSSMRCGKTQIAHHSVNTAQGKTKARVLSDSSLQLQFRDASTVRSQCFHCACTVFPSLLAEAISLYIYSEILATRKNPSLFTPSKSSQLRPPERPASIQSRSPRGILPLNAGTHTLKSFVVKTISVCDVRLQLLSSSLLMSV